MFEIIQKLAPAPPTCSNSHVAPLSSANDLNKARSRIQFPQGHIAGYINFNKYVHIWKPIHIEYLSDV